MSNLTKIPPRRTIRIALFALSGTKAERQPLAVAQETSLIAALLLLAGYSQ